jgi:hypothetical protein
MFGSHRPCGWGWRVYGRTDLGNLIGPKSAHLGMPPNGCLVRSQIDAKGLVVCHVTFDPLNVVRARMLERGSTLVPSEQLLATAVEGFLERKHCSDVVCDGGRCRPF